MPLAKAPMAVLATALRDPNVVIRYQAKIVTPPREASAKAKALKGGRGPGCGCTPRTPLTTGG
jgi:hypothetical protein